MTDWKKVWRAKNPERHTTALRRDRTKMRERHIAFVAWLRFGICRDCHEYSDEREFDHVRGPKLFNIGTQLRSGLTWSQLTDEIMKCDLVCPPCHASRTRSRGTAWRAGDPETPF